MRRGICGGVVGDAGGNDASTSRGGLRYSMPILLARREVLRMSFIRLYRSILKLRVGPADKRMIRTDGATGVKVNARR